MNDLRGTGVKWQNYKKDKWYLWKLYSKKLQVFLILPYFRLLSSIRSKLKHVTVSGKLLIFSENVVLIDFFVICIFQKIFYLSILSGIEKETDVSTNKNSYVREIKAIAFIVRDWRKFHLMHKIIAWYLYFTPIIQEIPQFFGKKQRTFLRLQFSVRIFAYELELALVFISVAF